MQASLPSIKSISIWTYVFSLGLWLSMCLGAAAIVVMLNIRDVEQTLIQNGEAYSQHLNEHMISSETILKGFSALFGAVGDTDPEKAGRYVRQVIDTNPQIFALEIVQEITKSQLVDFVEMKRSDGIPNFSIKSYSYDSDRKWVALQEKDFYYPIVFMEPMRAGSEDVLGLDMESVPFLKQAMTESLQRRAPVATHPFRLVEGKLAYVVFCPISQAFQRNDSPFALNTQGQTIVDMVIDAAELVDLERFPVKSGESVAVYHKDYQPDDPDGQLVAVAGRRRSLVETKLFPIFVYKKSLATLDEAFLLTVTRQVGWSDFSLGLLSLMAILTFTSSLIIVAYLRTQQQSKLLLSENQKRLWRLANHDTLTELPNRMLLMDRLSQLLARAKRQKKGLAVMFLDIDDFKMVNDRHGHEAGDRLLKFVAERLMASIRVEDTVARMSGDEFIILIEGVENRDALNSVRRKIRQNLSEGLLIDDQPIRVCPSIGIALFPEDGDQPEALIKQADMRMYEDKQTKGVKLHLV